MIRHMARFELPAEQREQLEKSRRECERLERQLTEAKARRNGLIIAALQQHGERRGAVAAVARFSGLTPEAVRKLHRNPEDPWAQPS